MRITGGELGGLTLRVPKGDRVRPTQDRVREAVFSMLGGAVTGARVLDLFAGTGSLGLEAASRGAAHVVWVEQDRRVSATLKENAAHLHVDGTTTETVCCDALRWLRGWRGQPFDLVFADPPYAWITQEGWGKVMVPLAGGVLRPGGLFVAEQGADLPAPGCAPPWVLLRDRAYGGTRICLWQHPS